MKFLIKSVALMASIMLIFSSSLFVRADEDIYGTEEKGILTTTEKNHLQIPPTDDFKNSGFSEGFHYWARTGGGYASDLGEIVASGDNKYLKLNLETDDFALSTVKFRINKEYVHFGRQLVVLYDWAGDDKFDIVLKQYSGTKTRTISSGVGKRIYTAKNENEWNTTVTAAYLPLFEPDDNAYYFTVSIQLLDITAPSKALIDNIRIVSVNSSGVVYDLDGNEMNIIPRRTDSGETKITVYKDNAQQNSSPQNEGNIVDANTIVVLCSIGGAALCMMAVAIVLIAFNGKPKKKRPKNVTDKGIFEHYNDEKEKESDNALEAERE